MRLDSQPQPLAFPDLADSVADNVFELSDDLLGSARADGYFEALNPAWERVTGFTLQELMAQPFIEFVHPGDREATLAEAAKVATDGLASVSFKNRYALRDGGWCWLSWKCAFRDGRFYFVAHDVTERVARDQRDHLMANLVGGIDDAILTKTLDGVVTSWNRAAEDLYGYSADEAIGRTMADLVVPVNLRDEPRLIVERLLRGEDVRQYSTRRHRKDGSALNVALTASLLRDVDHEPFGVAVISRNRAELSDTSLRMTGEVDTMAWVGRLRDAIDEDRIVFHAQPIVSLAGAPKSYELLCRMIGCDGSVIPPARFMPAAEKYGLIEELDLLAVDEGARQIGLGHAVSVNLSTATVGRRHVVDLLEEKLHRAGADPARMTIEITETALMKDVADAQRFAAGVTDLGCRLSLDDFGTGFGGFTYLKKLRLDQLKIDSEFVRDLNSSRASQHVVQAVVALADGFGLETVAEGVEDDATLGLLKRLGVTHVQGYYLGRPSPVADLPPQPDHAPSERHASVLIRGIGMRPAQVDVLKDGPCAR